MKIISFAFTILLSTTSFAGLFGGEPSKSDLNKNLRIENLIDETHDFKLIDFIEHGYPGAKISWKEAEKNNYYLTIKYKNEMKNQTNLIKYHLKFGPNYVDMLEASADGQVIPPKMFPSIFVQMLLAIGDKTGNKKFTLKSKSSSAVAESEEKTNTSSIDKILGKHCTEKLAYNLTRVDSKNLNLDVTGGKCNLLNQKLLIKEVIPDQLITLEIKPNCNFTIMVRGKIFNDRIGISPSWSCDSEYLKTISGCELLMLGFTTPDPCD